MYRGSSSQSAHKVHEYQNVFWSDFCQKWLDFGQMLVRFSGKIGQIVSQILESLVTF